MLALDLFAYERPQRIRAQAARELKEADLPQALLLLAENPLRGVHLRSLLEDNGLDPAANRGRFYGYFENGQLVGLALLGHAMMIYARPAAESQALAFFAEQAVKAAVTSRVIFGPHAQVEAFWQHLERKGWKTKEVRDMRWYVCHKPRLDVEALQLRRANLDELEAIAKAQAEQFREETGTDPRAADPEGFKRRVAQRIKRERTWIKLEDGEVTFKTELQSVTPEVVYLEGVWTREDYRGQGIAKQCLTELAHRLRRQRQLLCLAVEPEEMVAIRLYEQVGFDYVEDYQARYLN